MVRQTLGSVRSIISRVTQKSNCEDDEYIVSLINEAQQRLLMKGKFAGTKVLYNFCAYDGCITLPRELEAVLAVSICYHNPRVQNEWFEFIPGLSPQTPGFTCNPSLVPRGTSPLFKDICGSKYLKVYCDLSDDASLPILFKGFDENGNEIMTQVNGEWIQGEYISPSTTGTLSTKQYTYISSVVKEITTGYIRVYQVDVDDTTSQTVSGLFAPSETLPSYRKYFYAPLSSNGSCGCGSRVSNSTENPKVVSILAKRGYVPVYNDNDDLVITNIPALKAMCMAIEKYEANNPQEAQFYETQAERYLDEELKEYNGGSTGNVPVDLRYRMGSVRSLI